MIDVYITVLNYVSGSVVIAKARLPAEYQTEDVEDYVEEVLKLRASDCNFMISDVPLRLEVR